MRPFRRTRRRYKSIPWAALQWYANACLASSSNACLAIPTQPFLHHTHPYGADTQRMRHTELTWSGCAGVSRQPSCCASTTGQVESCAEHVRARAKAVSVLDQGASPPWSRTHEPVVSSSRGAPPNITLIQSYQSLNRALIEP